MYEVKATLRAHIGACGYLRVEMSLSRHRLLKFAACHKNMSESYFRLNIVPAPEESDYMLT